MAPDRRVRCERIQSAGDETIKTTAHHAFTAALLLTLVAAAPVAAQDDRPVTPTDSITGELLHWQPSMFVLRTDDGDERVFHIEPDPEEEAFEEVPDSVVRPVPHTSFMSRRDMLLALEQVEESDERSRIHVHYLPSEETDGGPVAVWISAAASRVPGVPPDTVSGPGS